MQHWCVQLIFIPMKHCCNNDGQKRKSYFANIYYRPIEKDAMVVQGEEYEIRSCVEHTTECAKVGSIYIKLLQFCMDKCYTF